MSSRMLKQSDNFKLLHKCLPSQRKVLLKLANPALIHAIFDCITNIIHQRIPITAKQKGVLAKKKRVENISRQQNKNPKEERAFNSTRWWYFEKYSGNGVERPCVLMSITPRKNLLVIPSDMYDRMTNHTAKSYQPEKNELIKSEEVMQNIWNTSVPPMKNRNSSPRNSTNLGHF